MGAPSQAVATTRAFSTALPRGFAASKPSYDKSSSRPVRSNPLVGNYAPAEPAQRKDKTSPASTPTPTPTPQKASESSAEMPPTVDILPPRPPPPPSMSSVNESAPAQRAEFQSQFAYNAVESRPIIDIAHIISDKSAAFGRAQGVSNPLDRPNVRAKAVAGRTVFIKDRLTPQSAPTPMVALRVLDKMCRDQKIKNKFHSQKFHERKGLKKKRLRSQRWRSRFKTGFKAAVSRVLELKKQGW
ncbi:hypothetical protein QQS21_000761 [Conoideocrella luteorostrata]|uniref:Ribosomal protein S21 n=1 Tax=Conoideocrella luteorostrata TaxID=1105319 RepID=A0AAJ0G2C4_9HYPO|nr:hypothetical protein QQS21_000761 [Conoideocrella luteorostrata]